MQILSQQNKKFYISELGPNSLKLESNLEISTDKGSGLIHLILSCPVNYKIDFLIEAFFKWHHARRPFCGNFFKGRSYFGVFPRGKKHKKLLKSQTVPPFASPREAYGLFDI